MKFQKKVIYSIFFAFAVFFISLFTKIIPCQTAPEIPNPVYSWHLCDLNPDSQLVRGIQRRYFGYTSSMAEAYLIVLAMAFVISMVFLHLITKTKKQ